MDSTQPLPHPPTTFHRATGRGLFHVVRDGAALATPLLRQQHGAGGVAQTRPSRLNIAEFRADHAPRHAVAPPSDAVCDPTVLRLMAPRGEAAFNSAAGATDPHFRHRWDTRRLLFMHPCDMAARGLIEGDLAHVAPVARAEVPCELAAMRVVPYDMPRGSVGGYFAECQPLIGALERAGWSIAVRVRSASA